MSLLSHPRSLHITRLTQFIIGAAFLILICYSGVHRGWWTSINGPLALGVIASVSTFALTIHSLVTHHLMKRNPFSGGSAVRTTVRLAAEAVVFLLWIATAVLMLRPKGGCPEEDKTQGYPVHVPKDEDGLNVCATGEHTGRLWTDQPRTEWNVAVAFDFVEIVAFIFSALLVFKDDRASKVSGGTSYA